MRFLFLVLLLWTSLYSGANDDSNCTSSSNDSQSCSLPAVLRKFRISSDLHCRKVYGNLQKKVLKKNSPYAFTTLVMCPADQFDQTDRKHLPPEINVRLLEGEIPDERLSYPWNIATLALAISSDQIGPAKACLIKLQKKGISPETMENDVSRCLASTVEPTSTKIDYCLQNLASLQSKNKIPPATPIIVRFDNEENSFGITHAPRNLKRR